MDQALTTLRMAVRHRALFARPLALPLAALALFALAQPGINRALLEYARSAEYMIPNAVIVLLRAAVFAPYAALNALGVAMVVHVVAERAAVARWLPSAAALRLAAVMAASVLVVYALLLVPDLAIRQAMLAPPGGLAGEVGPAPQALLVLLETVDWTWTLTVVPAIVAARRLFGPAAASTPAPRSGRVAAAAGLVFACTNAILLGERLLAALLPSGTGGLQPAIAVLGGVALDVVGAAIMMPILAVAIAVAAFAGSAAARSPAR